MWTTRTLVKEIRHNRDEISRRLTAIEEEQKVNFQSFSKLLILLEQKIDLINQASLSWQKQIEGNYLETLNKLDSLHDFVSHTDKGISAKIDESLQEINKNIVNISESENKNLLSVIKKTEQDLYDNVTFISEKYRSTTHEEITDIIKSMKDSFGRSFDLVENSSKQLCLKTEQQMNGLVTEINTLLDSKNEVLSTNIALTKEEILKVIAQHQENEEVSGDNIAAMNTTLEEVVKNLTALDEGNRLIIAKLLLKDMEV